MINLRYHIVSITAVFLALGIGVLVGTTVTDQAVVSVLRTRLDAARNHSRDVESSNVALREELTVWERWGRDTVEPLIRGRLEGVQVVIVSAPAASRDLIRDVEGSLATAGATRAGHVELTEKWALGSEAARRDLVGALDLTASGDRTLVRNAALQLGARLAATADTRAPDDTIGRLERAGFASLAGADAGAFPPAGAVVVVVGGDATAPSPKDLMLPLLGNLAGARAVVAAQALDAKSPLVPDVRSAADLADRIGTVDHADTLPGSLSLIVALVDARAGTADHFGIRRGATAVAPEVSP